ncbi:hypothetical protein AB0I95_18970 [Micromonospora sp. NPDC049751]|uniref:hypothetical protein n=1 Tax=Micromonospora sp. NPDC049751 TaxID=3154837 RepID=UPI0033E97274
MAEPLLSPSRSSRDRWRGVVAGAMRWGLPLLWVLWAALAWWVTPREATAGQLDRDLAAGRVVTFQRASGWADDDLYWGSRPHLRYDMRGAMIAWSVPSGRVRYAFVDPPNAQAQSLVPEATERPDGLDARLAASARPWQASGVAAHRLADTAGLLAGAVTLMWLLRLVGGAPPAVGTRWFWWWIGLLPFGVGVLAWSYREIWRPPPVPPPARGSGWRGVGWLLLAGIGIAMLVSAARALLGAAVVPG